jgi:hypothetical protein
VVSLLLLREELGQISQYSHQAVVWTTKESEFDSGQRKEIIIFSVASKAILGPTQPPTQCVLGAVSQG